MFSSRISEREHFVSVKDVGDARRSTVLISRLIARFLPASASAAHCMVVIFV